LFYSKREKPATGPSPPDALSAALDDVEKEYKHSRTQACAIKVMVDARLSALKARAIAEGESPTHAESRFTSLTGAESGTILKMCPTRTENTLNDGAFAHHVRLRLNAANPDQYVLCRLCNPVNAASSSSRPTQDNLFHALHCVGLRAEATDTHHRIVRAIVKVINEQLGLRATLSNRKLTGEDRNGKAAFVIPDGEIVCGDTTIWIDVGVVNKHAPSNMGKHDLEGDYADAKFKKYEDLVKVICAQGHGQFYPVIIDHFGTPHRQALNFITSIVGLYRSSYIGSPVEAPLSPLEAYKLLLETIVAEFARANAIRSNKWHVHHALSPYGPPTPRRPTGGPLAPKAAPCQKRGASTPAVLRERTETAPTALKTQTVSPHIGRCRSYQTTRPCPSLVWRAQRLTIQTPRSRLPAITPRPSRRPATTWPPLWMHAEAQPRGQRKNSPASITPRVRRRTTSPVSTHRPLRR